MSDEKNSLKSKFAIINQLWGVKKEFRLKVFFQALTFALLTGCVAIWRPLKVGVFCKIVGASYIPEAKLYVLVFLIPLLLLYSKLVDWLKRHQLLYSFTLFHGIGGIIFYFLLSHPVYGIANTQTSPDRTLGWVFYFFMESLTAFLSTVFWSFADSVNNPKDAKNFYGIFVTGSKIGGIVSAGGLYLFITYMGATHGNAILINVLLVGSFMLLGAGLSVYFLIKKVPGYYMHGYEAVYQLEKKRDKKTKGKKINIIKSIKSSFEGLFIIFKNKYVLGIFSTIVFYEIMIVILDFRVAMTADTAYKTASGLTGYYALYYLLMNSFGLVVTIFGTTPILKLVGIRTTLIIFPIISAILIFTTYLYPTAGTFFIVLVLLRAIDYAFNHPTREILYIPTTKSVKFKAKAWNDAFGTRFAKSTGSTLNLFLRKLSTNLSLTISTIVIMGMISAWFAVVIFLGKVVHETISNKEIIGDEEAEHEG